MRNGFRGILDELDNLEGHRTPVGWTPQHAAMRTKLQRELMESLGRPAGDPEADRVQCEVPVAVRTRAGQFVVRACEIGTGGVFVAVERPVETGAAVELVVKGDGYGHQPCVRGRVARVVPSPAGGRPTAVVSLSLARNEGDERRQQRFVVELLRHRRDV